MKLLTMALAGLLNAIRIACIIYVNGTIFMARMFFLESYYTPVLLYGIGGAGLIFSEHWKSTVVGLILIVAATGNGTLVYLAGQGWFKWEPIPLRRIEPEDHG